MLTSCTKEYSSIGKGLIDENQLLSMGYTDTVTLRAYSIPEDSVVTSNLSFAQVGSMYDPVFGITKATFYSQIFLSKNNTDFGTSPVFDSAFLYMPLSDSYGDTMSNMTLTIYPLTEAIVDSLTYYSHSTVAYDPSKPLGTITFQPRPNDSSYYNGAMHIPTLRIQLNQSFGQDILSIDTSLLTDNDAFVGEYKGICIVANDPTGSGKGCILNTNLNSTGSKIQMYYHNSEDTTNYTFYLNTECARFQNYNHNNYAEAIPALREQLTGNQSLGNQFLFAQGMGGIKIKIEFPFMDKWAGTDKIVINDAQLIIGNASVSDVFTNPTSVTLRTVGLAGTTNPNNLVDVDDTYGYFDGTYNQTSNSYRFRIRGYLQKLMLGDLHNTGLHLILPGASYYGQRLVLHGTSSEVSDLKLYLKYTRIK
jgi:hypothetical protein